MKDKNPNLEEIEDPHTLGGVVGEDRVQGRGKWTLSGGGGVCSE